MSSDQKRLLLRGGTLVSPELGILRADVLIADGRIASISTDSSEPKECRTIDVSGLHVFPGFIDPHMHLGQQRPFERDVRTETAAAAFGGTTTLLTFCKVARHRAGQQSYLSLFDEVARSIDDHAFVDVGLHCVVGTEQHIAEIPTCVSRGIRSFKFYMAYRDDEAAVARGVIGLDDGILFKGFQKLGAEVSRPAVAMVHCENNDVCRRLTAELAAEPMDYRGWASARPDFGEAEAVARAGMLTAAAGSDLYLVHISSAAGLEAARASRRHASRRVWVETTPHYLTLSAESVSLYRNPAVAKVAPPLRKESDIAALWAGIRDGSVDTVGTDHCPVEPPTSSDLRVTNPGFPSVELYPSLLLTGAMQRDVPLEQVAAVSSTNPARIFGLYPRKGSLLPGADADLAVVDLGKPWTFDVDRAMSATTFSPYDGIRLSVTVELTILRGHVVHESAKATGDHHGRALFASATAGRAT